MAGLCRCFSNKIILIIFGLSIITFAFGETNTIFTTLSPDNPVLELIDAELSGNKDSMYKALKIIDTLLDDYKKQISTLSDKSSELLTIEKQCTIFYSIVNSSITIIENVTFLTEGLLRKQPQRDCDTGCLLFLIAGYEFNWPVSVYLGEQKVKTDNDRHALLYVHVSQESSLFFETTNGKWYSSLDRDPYYYYNFICITGEQLYGIYYTLIAAKYLNNDDFSHAIICLEKAIDLKTTHLDEAFFTIGTAYLKTKEYGKAIEAFEKSLDLSPDVLHTIENLLLSYCHLGDYYFQNKEFPEAVCIYEKGLKRFPGNQEILEDLLISYTYAAYYYFVIKNY